MKLIVGLGNPEPRYAKTRHNAGFMVIDRLRERHAPTEPVRAKFHADLVDARLGSERCLLIKPMTYMNRSGRAVAEARRFYKLEDPGAVLVITDDVALPVGMIRLRARGGAGGHNGLSDIELALGTDAYPRCRVGIGPKPPMVDQADFVLSRFFPEDEPELDRALAAAADAVEVFATEGITTAMNRFNVKVGAAEKRGAGEPDSSTSESGNVEPTDQNQT